MNKAGWFGWLFVGAGMGLLFFFLNEDWVTKEQLEMIRWDYESYRSDLDMHTAQVEDLFKKYPQYLKGLAPAEDVRTFIRSENAFMEAWLDTEPPRLRETYLYGEADVLVAFSEEQVRITEMFLNERPMALRIQVETLRDIVRRVYRLEPEMEASRTRVYDLISRPRSDFVRSTLNQFSRMHPERGRELENRRMHLEAVYLGVRAAHTALEVALSFRPLRYYEMTELADITIRSARQFKYELSQLIKDALHYPLTVDRILVDMQKVKDECLHKYDEQRGTKIIQYWAVVPCEMYRRYEGALGMHILRKKPQQFYGEADTLASPPGYAFVGDPTYGRWREEGGSATWDWHGTMQNPAHYTLWLNRHLTPISRTQWTVYERFKAKNEVFYGTESRGTRYGSEAPSTRIRYASSRYVIHRDMINSATDRRSGYSGSSSTYSGSSYGGGGK